MLAFAIKLKSITGAEKSVQRKIEIAFLSVATSFRKTKTKTYGVVRWGGYHGIL